LLLGRLYLFIVFNCFSNLGFNFGLISLTLDIPSHGLSLFWLSLSLFGLSLGLRLNLDRYFFLGLFVVLFLCLFLRLLRFLA
jgi:hypothetical protein